MSTDRTCSTPRSRAGKRALAAALLAMLVWGGVAVVKAGPRPSADVRAGNSWGRMMVVNTSADEAPVS